MAEQRSNKVKRSDTTSGYPSYGVTSSDKKAAALRYKHGEDPLPKMVAKGQGRIAEKIIELAKDHNIEIREDPDLVNLLTKLDVNDLIPESLFRAVAEVMAYVYRMNGSEVNPESKT